jgi:hypothetical protein
VETDSILSGWRQVPFFIGGTGSNYQGGSRVPSYLGGGRVPSYLGGGRVPSYLGGGRVPSSHCVVSNWRQLLD